MRKLTHEEFLEQLYEKNEYYRNGEIAIQGEYEGMESHILFMDNRAIMHSTKCKSLLQNNGPTILTAMDKTEFAKSLFYELHGNRYNYDKLNYINSRTPFTVTCNIHGDFSSVLGSHIRGNGCKKCAAYKLGERRSITPDEFFAKVYENNEYYRNGDLIIDGDYTGMESRYSVFDRDGNKFLVLGGNLCQNYMPSIVTAEDKTGLIIKKFREVHGDYYNYDQVDYKYTDEPVVIGCPVHGLFHQKPDLHLTGRGCLKCGHKTAADKRTMSEEDFIAKANLVHNNKYSYENLNYINSKSNVTVTCSVHGKFQQNANNHLHGSGCIKCKLDRQSEDMKYGELNSISYSKWGVMGKRSKYFDSYKVYIVVCTGHDESFIKIGKTYNTVDKRLRYIPYDFTLYDVITEADHIKVCKIEHSMQRSLKEYRYKTSKSFGGEFECFNMDALHSGVIDQLIKSHRDVAAG